MQPKQIVVTLVIVMMLITYGAYERNNGQQPLFFDVEAGFNQNDRIMLVQGETNMPPGTKLAVIVQGMEAPFIVWAIMEAEVNDGRYETFIEYSDGHPFPGLYRVIVAFSPLGQNAEVVSLVGETGEKIPEIGLAKGELILQEEPLNIHYIHNYTEIQVE